MPGDCHYLEGNVNAKRRIGHIKKILGEIGIEPERVQMFNVSAAMSGEFVRITKEMTEQIKALGPNPLKMTKHNAIKMENKEDGA